MLLNKLIIETKKKYKIKDNFVLNEIIFFLSPTIKNISDIIINMNKEINFKEEIFSKLVTDYYEKLKPLSHIIKKINFCNIDFAINNKVLSPRLETEWMVKEFIKKYKNKNKKIIFDLCSGSGAIGLSIKKHCDQHIIYCVDISRQAIKNIKENTKLLNLDIHIFKQDIFKFLKTINIKPDIIICNPPYVSKFDKLDKRVLKWEPKKAFFAKNDGIYFYQEIFKKYKNNSDIKIWLETGFNQKIKIKNIFKELNPNFKLNFYKNIWKKTSLILINDIIF